MSAATTSKFNPTPNTPRQSARAVIPTIITQIAAGKKQIQLGDVSPTRDINYVLDTCKGFIDLAQSDKTIGEVA
jgi:nucleoside-diphosphate-sugar epimerase